MGARWSWGKLSSAPKALATDWLEGRGHGHHRMQCQEGSSSRGGAEQGRAGPGRAAHSSRPRLPYRRWPRAQNSPKSGSSSSVRAPSHPAVGFALGESQGWQGPLYQGKCQAACLLRSLTCPENPLNPGHNPDAPVLPHPPAEAAPRPARSLLRPHLALYPH